MNKESFFTNIKKRMGHPFRVLEIDEEQLDICLKDALDFYLEYSYEGVKPYALVMSIIPGQREYTLPSNVYSVIEFFVTENVYGTPTYRKIIAEHMLYSSPHMDIADFALFNAYYQDVSSLTIPHYDFHFNRFTKKLTFMNIPDTNSVCCKIFVDETVDSLENILEDRWFQQYVTTLAKIQWSENISKYDKDLVGGAKVNYERIYDKAQEEKEKLEQFLLSKAEPIDMMIA